MKNIKTTIAISAFVITTLVACSSSVSNKENGTDDGVSESKSNAVSSIPAFTVQNAAGKTVDFQSLKGKKVFINLWAAWCPPCKAEMPSIAALHNKIDKDKTVFILLSLDENFESSIDFMNKNNFDLPVYFPTQQLPAMFNTGGIPATFIFNENGELIKQNNGMDDYDTEEYLKILSS